jgi:hypothetical protein
MSNKSTLLATVSSWDEAACGAALDVLGIPQATASGRDDPDSNGLVAFTGLRPNHPRAGYRFHVDEVVAGLPPGHAKDLGNANLRFMNAMNMILGWGNAASRAGVVGTGEQAHVDPHSDNIPNSLVFAAKDARSNAPLWDTVQKATDFLNSFPDSAFGVQSGDGFHA